MLNKSRAQSWPEEGSLHEIGSFACAQRDGYKETEDRIIYEHLPDQGIDLFGVFDGHGGTYAVDFISATITRLIKEKIAALYIEKDQLTVDECNQRICAVLEESFLAADDELLLGEDFEGGSTGNLPSIPLS